MNPIYRRAAFTVSAPKLKDLPADEGDEVAFAGRSNAGKSSALNAITDNKSLARVSKQPGRTQAINLFPFAAQKTLVDLPGYGFAKVSKDMKKRWQQTMGRYLNERASLRGLVVVMDVRHPLSEHDQQMLSWAHQAELPVHCLLTKADKLSKNAAHASLSKTRSQLQQLAPSASAQLFSALKKIGIDEVHECLDHWFDLNQSNE